ncbi:MAG TPA: hypothetical protein VFI11_07825 [Anaerolineales bacterium]|nr:hypothetical protein [Anaerolineales bacterium]
MALLVLGFGRVYSDFVQDDAYITYRYARNLTSGLGFVYNEGEQVLGTSTPLYVLTLALLSSVARQSVPEVGVALGQVSLWTAGIVIYTLGRKLGPARSAVASLFLLTSPFLRHMVGMEAFFLLALLLLATWAFLQERLGLAALLLGALVLVRYEMSIYALVLALVGFVRARRSPVWLWPAAPIIAAWAAIAFLWFGSPIPLSVPAKLATIRIPFAAGFLFYEAAFTRENPSWAVHGLFLIMGIAYMILRRNAPRAYELLVLWALTYFVLASVVAGSFPWYYAPLLPGIAASIAWGVDQVARRLTIHQDSSSKLPQRVFLVLSGVVVGASLVFWVRDWRDYRGGAFDHRFEAFRQASDWLRQHASAEATLAASEIGYVGYFTDMHIVDLYGLVTPGVHPWLPRGLDFTTSQALEAYAPDYYLVLARAAPPEQQMRDAGYSMAASFSDDYLLFEKTATGE